MGRSGGRGPKQEIKRDGGRDQKEGHGALGPGIERPLAKHPHSALHRGHELLGLERSGLPRQGPACSPGSKGQRV